MRDEDATDTESGEQDGGPGKAALSRRASLALLGSVSGLGLLAGCNDRTGGEESATDQETARRGTAGTGRGTTDRVTGAGDRGARTWDGDVDAAGHDLRDLGSLGLAGTDGQVSDLAGEGLAVDDGTLSTDPSVDAIRPESHHLVNEYPGDTLDQKLTAAIDRAAETAVKSGHRFVVAPPDPDDPAADDGPAWRLENPVVIDRNRGGYHFDFGRTRVHATDEMESMFVVGPDEKTEGIAIEGGTFGAMGNLRRSFVDVQGIGHMWIDRVYLAGGVDYGRNSVPAGIRLADGHGTSELTITDTEVTGCTDGFLATQTADVPYGAAFDLDIYNFRAGGGETSVRIDGGVGVNLHSIQAGGHPVQSVSDSIVRFENGRNAVRKADVSFVRERHNAMDFHSGVRTVDVTSGSGPRHEGVAIRNVDVHHAEYGTDLNHVVGFDQQHVRPPPAPVGPESSGTSRWYDRSQVFDSTRGHEFRVDGDAAVTVAAGGLRHTGDGSGPILTTPDGNERYRLRLDDDGAIVTEAVGPVTAAGVGPPADADVTVVDDFEDGDLAAYTGSTEAYEVTAGAPVGEGDYSLKSLGTGAGPIVSTGGLAPYPSAGDTIAAKVAQTEAHPFVGVAWGVQDVDNFYWARVDTTEDRLGLWKMRAGEPTPLARTPYRLDDTGTVHEFVVRWGIDGETTVEFYSVANGLEASASATDTAFDRGGIGLRQGGMLDYVRFW